MGIFKRQTATADPPEVELEASAQAGSSGIGSRGPSALDPFTVPDLSGVGFTRADLWGIPAVANGLQTIAASVASFPLFQVSNDTNEREITPTLRQLDPDETRYATMTRLVEDLVLFPDAYLVVIARYADSGFPRWLRYVPHEAVQPPAVGSPQDRLSSTPLGFPTRSAVDDGWRVYDRPVPARDVIRFRSHWPGLIRAGHRTILIHALLEAAARRFSRMDIPLGVLKNKGADLTGPEIQELLSDWATGQEEGGTRYLNSVLDYEPTPLKAEDLALTEQREHNVAEFARLLNLPAHQLNAPQPTSLTYRNLEGHRRDLVDISLRPYLTTVESRLSLDDLTPRRHDVLFSLDQFIRSDTQTRYETYAIGLTNRFLTVDEVRELERLPEIDEPDEPIESTPTLEVVPEPQEAQR